MSLCFDGYSSYILFLQNFLQLKMIILTYTSSKVEDLELSSLRLEIYVNNNYTDGEHFM